jgi:hypothetical protein
MTTATASYTYSPIPVPPHVSKEHFKEFGREVHGYDPANVTEAQTKEIVEMLYKVSLAGVGCGEGR